MKKVIMTVLLVIGFFIFYFLWPRTIELPHIGTVKEWPLTEVGGNEASFREKPKLITFFFTNCPDVCPTTMWDLKKLHQVMEERGISQDEYFIIAVTVDPEYDTNDKIIQYKDMFEINSPNWLFFRGAEEETYKFTQYFNFSYEKNEDGFLTHSTSMYVVDSNDKIRAHHDMALGKKQVNIEEIADHLEQLLK
nr:SCO family protein [Filibacter tadaridae]